MHVAGRSDRPAAIASGQLSENAEPQVEVRGDDNFGWRITVTYFRDQTSEEAELERRYATRAAVGRRSPRPLLAILAFANAHDG